MKNIKSIVKACIFAVVATISQTSLSIIDSIFTSDRVVTISQVYDQYGYTIIQASVGNVIAGVVDPVNLWVVTTLSAGISNFNNPNPIALANLSGDIIVSWTYLDTNFVPQIAAAILPQGTSTWSVTILSGSVGSYSQGDQTIAMDSKGNVLVTWTAFDYNQNQNNVYGALLAMGSNSWSTPFVILPG